MEPNYHNGTQFYKFKFLLPVFRL